jgi:hypothetical protein
MIQGLLVMQIRSTFVTRDHVGCTIPSQLFEEIIAEQRFTLHLKCSLLTSRFLSRGMRYTHMYVCGVILVT